VATIEETLAEIGTLPRVYPVLPSHLDLIRTIHAQVLQDRERLRGELELSIADRNGLRTALADAEAKILWCENRIRELEGGTPPSPTRKKPAILYELFDKPLDMGVYYIDKDGAAGTVSVANGECLFRWKATSDLTDMRAQMVMREHLGTTDGTPRRDPIGSERFYGFGIYLPPAYSFGDEWANRKCVTGQAHQGNQGGIVSPPFSFEMIKTSLDGEVMRGVLAVKGKETKTINIGKPPRTPTKILIHVKWSPGTDGFLKVYRDGVLTPFNHTGATCNPRTLNGETVQDLNPSIGCYNPSRKNGDFFVGYVREVAYTYWLIGNETNTLADMVA